MLIASPTVWGVDYSTLKTIGLVAFFGVFVIILLRLLLSRSSDYDEASRIPLQDDAERDPGQRSE